MERKLAYFSKLIFVGGYFGNSRLANIGFCIHNLLLGAKGSQLEFNKNLMVYTTLANPLASYPSFTHEN